MVPCFVVDNMWNSIPTPVSFWPASLETQTTTDFHTAWPRFPATVPASRPTFVAADRAATVVSSLGLPPFYVPPFENQTARYGSFHSSIGSKKQSRKASLQRSVLGLVNSHQYLDLSGSELLRWYLCLSLEDRKIIQDEGGFRQFLQSHPSLDLYQNQVSVKYPFGSSGIPQPTVTSSQNECGTYGPRMCMCEECCQTWQQLPRNVRENVSLIGFCSSSEAQDYLCEEPVHQVYSCPFTQNTHLDRMDSSSISPAACCSSLERCWQKKLRGQSSATCVQSGDVSKPGAGPSKPEWPTRTGDHQGVDRIQNSQSSDVCIIQPVPTEEKGPIHSIITEDGSILTCLPSTDRQECLGGVPSLPAPINCETLTSDQSFIGRRDTAEKSTSTYTQTCDVMVSTELPPPCTSTHTQTKAPETSDQYVITEVYMSDMDYLTEKFIKLKMSQEAKEKTRRGSSLPRPSRKLRMHVVVSGQTGRKHRKRCSGCRRRTVCDCLQRAQQAELSLLALQYIMCRQHCCRLFFTSAERTQLHTSTDDAPANVVGILQKLDSDFEQMKHQILTGVPLEQLQPLSVDCVKITTGGRYVPAQVVGDVLGSVSTRSSEEQQKKETAEETGKFSQVRQRKLKQAKKDGEQTRRSATLVPSSRYISPNRKPESESKTCPAAQKDEVSSCEMWYDAEEVLELPAADQTLDKSHHSWKCEDFTTASGHHECVLDAESVCEEAGSSELDVSTLQSHTTERGVKQLLEKFQPSEVRNDSS
ncbi:RNA-binding protein 44 [Melanotaenia boesemani]|uniref:RNA-binding protein 44 n=1 Tax=Melanotaenia boesemani TaxID=1250792 RepID=UPI001C050586|nr:RNA-binding protein 44 [Melanotaenia boesemani]